MCGLLARYDAESWLAFPLTLEQKHHAGEELLQMTLESWHRLVFSFQTPAYDILGVSAYEEWQQEPAEAVAARVQAKGEACRR